MVEAGMGLQPMRVAIADGQYTSTIYGWIKESKFEDVLTVLEPLVEESPDNRAGLSLLGYCYYQTGKFDLAVQVYEKLSKIYPEQADYVFYYAQCLFKLGLYAESIKAAGHLERQDKRALLLQASIRYEEENTVSARGILDQYEDEEDEDVVVCKACCLYKEEDFEGAKTKFEEAMSKQGYQADLAYGIALCYYRMKQYGLSLKHLAEIVDSGVREHPELSVGSYGDTLNDARSVGNSSVLKDTALIEAFNLKGAIEYAMKNVEAAKEALTDMPPRQEEELDPVTLHNQALMRMDEDPTGGFRKFNLLLKNPPAPAETFGNLLLLYCKPQYAFYDLAADVMAENAHLVQRHLSPILYEYLDATILRQNAPEKAYQKYDLLAQRHVDLLRRLTKQIQDARLQRDNEAIKRSITEYDDALEAYIPVLMAMASMHWDLENYGEVEKIFRQSAEFCSENETWKLNVAHCFFMQDDKFKEAIRYYEPFVKKHAENLLGITAIILANLCVAYIMTSKNEEAEDLMRRIEQEEERMAYHEPQTQNFHLCIVNLVIGTLYCAKGNFEFGVTRIIKSLEPYNKKIETDTWFYCKRCLLSMIENGAKRLITINDATAYEVMNFLLEAEKHGKDIRTTLATANEKENLERLTVAQEARFIRKVLMKVMHF